MILRVPPLSAQALMLMLLTPGACIQVIKNCRDLKATVEGAASRGHGAVADLTLQLRGYLQYHCEESVRIAASQSVKVVGDGGSAVNVYVALKPPGLTEAPADSGASSAWGIGDDGRVEEGITKSLFVNEGTLSLENISFHLNSAQGEMYEAPAGEGKRTPWKHRCIGTTRLVRNSGHLMMQNSSVVDTPSVYSGSRLPPNCRPWNESAQQGRVVYSDGNNRSTVTVSRSNFYLTFHGEAGEGSAFYTKGGTVGIESTCFGTKASHPRKKTSHETAGIRGTAAVPLTVSVSGGCSDVSDAAFTGRGVGVTVRGDGAVVFEERKGIPGEYLLVKADCSFLRRDTNSVDDDNASVLHSSSGVRMSSANLRPRGHRQLLAACTPFGCTDQVWLLVVVLAGLITLMGLCCLSRRRPDGRRRWALLWCCRARHRRVQQDGHADGMAAARATGVAGGDLKAGGVTHNSLKQPHHLHVALYSMRDPSYEDERSFVLPQDLKKLLAKPQANVRSIVEDPGGIAADDGADDDANDCDSKIAETIITSSRSSDETPADEGEPGLPPFAIDHDDVSDVSVPRQTAIRDDVFDSGVQCFSDDSLVKEETVTVPIRKKFTSARIYRSGSRELPTSPLQVQPRLPVISCSAPPGEGATAPEERRCKLDTLLCDGGKQGQAAVGHTASEATADGRDACSLSPRTASSRSRSRGGPCSVDLALAEAASSTRWIDQMPKEPDDDMSYSPDNEIDGEFFAIMSRQTSGAVLVSPSSQHGEKPERFAAALTEAITSEVTHASPVPLVLSAEVGPCSGNNGDVLCYSASPAESGTGRNSFSSAGSPVFVSSAEEYTATTVRKMASTNTNGGRRAAASPLSHSGGTSPGSGDHDGGFCYSASSTESGTGRNSFSSAGSPVFVSAAEEYAAAAAAAAARKMASTNTSGGHRATASPLSRSAGINPGFGGHEDEMCYSASSTESGAAEGGFSSRGSPVAVSAVQGNAALEARKGAGTISSTSSSRHERSRDRIPQDAHVD